MIFDEVFDKSIHDNSPMMNNATIRYTSRLVSPSYNQQQDTADCYAMPIDVPISPCTSEESSASAAAMSITGKFSNIEQNYHIDQRVLGTGHHGTVRECIDRTTGQRCAAKSIRKSDPAVKPGGLAREIMLLQDMKHRTIVQLVDVYEDAEYVHIVTDLCKGGELFDKIVEKSSNSCNGAKCFAEDEAARIIHQVLMAVSYMHKKHIVHRDIKPENILFEKTDEASPVKIIDLGLARKHFGGLEPPMTTIVGTPYYIAPEVLRKKYDKSCDLWSVGVVAYILLCGYPPFNGTNNDETHRAVLRGQYHFPSKDWKGASQEARDFIRRLLQMNPRKRMTAEEALNHPWLVRHTRIDVVMSADISEEVMVKGLRLPRRGSIFCGGIAKRKTRMSMFGI
jgi:serine/threonine protein kinase